MRLLAAFLMAVGMVMLSSSVPEPVSASECGYTVCVTPPEGGEPECVRVSTPCPPDPPDPPDDPPNLPDAGGTVYSNGTCDDEGPCSSDGGTLQNVPVSPPPPPRRSRRR